MQLLIFLKNLEKKRHLIFLKILIVSSIWLVKDAWIKPRCLQVVQQDLLWVPGYEWLWWCRHFSFSKIVININQSIQSINCESCFADSSTIFTFPSVRPQTWHPSISPLFDILDHTNQIFSESLWCPLSTHPPPLSRYPNTNTQIHKYTNTALVKVAQYGLYFWKGVGMRTSKIMFLTIWCANT